MADKIRMRTLVDRWSVSAVVFFVGLKLLQTLRRAGIRPSEDGFRRASRAFFQGEQAHPWMPAFGVTIPLSPTGGPEESPVLAVEVLEGLRDLLRARREMTRSLRWDRYQARLVPRRYLDLVQARFTKDGTLEAIRPLLDPSPAFPQDGENHMLDAATNAVVKAYNETGGLPDRRRPRELRRQALARIERIFPLRPEERRGMRALVDRLLSAVWVSTEVFADSTPGHRADLMARVHPPDLRSGLGPGSGGLVVVARVLPGTQGADLWFKYHHALFDGVPFSEVLAELVRRWGTAEPLVLPAARPVKGDRPVVRCSGPRAPESWVLQDRLDFGPLLHERRRLESIYARVLNGERISTVGLLVWHLAHQEAFDDRKFAVALDVPAAGGRERTLGIASIRPAVFFDNDDPDAALLAFNRELLRRIEGTRRRRSESYEMLESFALLPAWIFPLLLMLLGRGLRECTGTLGISVIREASLVIAAQADIYNDGFIGIGSFDLPVEDDGRAGIVMVKGPPDKIGGYADAMSAVVTRSARD